MIEIFRYGNSRIKNPEKYRIECPKCGCFFSFQFEDVIKSRYNDLVPCPNDACEKSKCGNEIEIGKTIPEFL